jgi:hypothetical protein
MVWWASDDRVHFFDTVLTTRAGGVTLDDRVRFFDKIVFASSTFTPG